MFSELFSYDPATIEPEVRERMVAIAKARTEYLRAAAEVNDFRARAWAGEEGLEDISSMKGADLTKLRSDYTEVVLDLLKASVDVEGLKETLPMIVLAVLQNLKFPLPVIAEAIGFDLDQLKLLVERLKKLIND